MLIDILVFEIQLENMVSLSECSTPATCVRQPFSLQHWAVLAVFKIGLRASSFPTTDAPYYFPDSELFEQFKTLTSRGFRILDYEFAISAYGCFLYRMPLRTFIMSWDRRNRATESDDQFIKHNIYVTKIAHNMNTLVPYCVCQSSSCESSKALTAENADRWNAELHKSQCRGQHYPTCDCMLDILHEVDTANKGHTMQCPRTEFRYGRNMK